MVIHHPSPTSNQSGRQLNNPLSSGPLRTTCFRIGGLWIFTASVKPLYQKRQLAGGKLSTGVFASIPARLRTGVRNRLDINTTHQLQFHVPFASSFSFPFLRTGSRP